MVLSRSARAVGECLFGLGIERRVVAALGQGVKCDAEVGERGRLFLRCCSADGQYIAVEGNGLLDGVPFRVRARLELR